MIDALGSGGKPAYHGRVDHARRNANLMLLLAAAIWGFAFVAQRVGMRHLEPLTFNGIRFALGAAVLVPLVLHRRRTRGGGWSPGLGRAGLVAGVLIFGGATLQQWGLVYTTAGKAGFITGLYVVFTPLLGLLWGQRTTPGAWIGVVLAAAGLYLLSARGIASIDPGDGLVLLSAVFWAGHVQWVGHAARRIDPLQLALVQFLVCAGLSTAGAFAFETVEPAAIVAAAVPIVYAGALSVGVAYTLQVVAQRHARPAPAAVILSLESVFAAVGGGLLLGEVLGLRGLAGCALMLGGVLVAQLGPAAPAAQAPERF
ncbi:MAG: DMT family transporter [Krumholzibacteria bacterium]|nr:DMT family transporter [Candidatus Krumholzibacteria bacterium]